MNLSTPFQSIRFWLGVVLVGALTLIFLEGGLVSAVRSWFAESASDPEPELESGAEEAASVSEEGGSPREAPTKTPAEPPAEPPAYASAAQFLTSGDRARALAQLRELRGTPSVRGWLLESVLEEPRTEEVSVWPAVEAAYSSNPHLASAASTLRWHARHRRDRLPEPTHIYEYQTWNLDRWPEAFDLEVKKKSTYRDRLLVESARALGDRNGLLVVWLLDSSFSRERLRAELEAWEGWSEHALFIVVLFQLRSDESFALGSEFKRSPVPILVALTREPNQYCPAAFTRPGTRLFLNRERELLLTLPPALPAEAVRLEVIRRAGLD